MRKYLLHIIVGILLPTLLWAHEIRPGYLEIKENADHSLQITWKQPMTGEYSIPLHPAYINWLDDGFAGSYFTN
jgi:hypothetical protein